MRPIDDVLKEAEANNILLYIKDDRLAFIAEKTSFPDGLKSEIAERKIEIIEALLAQSVDVTLAPFALLTESERAGYDARYDDAYPMSALQAGMVFHTQLEQFNGVYHDIVADHVQCPWNCACFEGALASCMQEHPILRTGFRLEGDRPLQHVHASMALPLTVEDLRDRSEAEQATYLSAWMETHKRHVFDWEHGPLFQIHIFRRTDASFEFVISFHHAVLDGWSRAALTTTLYNRYERALAGETLAAVAPDWTYRDFVAQEQATLSDPAAKAYFVAMLDEAPTVQLPRLPATTERRQVRARLAGFDAVSVRLVELARTLGVPVQSMLLAVHFKVLSTFSGQQPVLSCVTHNGRPETEGAEQALGLFLNSLPQSVTIPPGSWREWIQAVAAMNAASMAYRGYPLAKIQQDIGRSFSEVLFNYTHFHVYNQLAEAQDDALLSLGTTGFEQTNFDLLIDISRGVSDDSLNLAMVYDAQVFEASLIARLGATYLRAFEHLLAGLDAPHTAASLLDPEERARLLGESNAADAAVPVERCLHALFEAQAARTPDAPALMFDDATLCYGDLDKRANQLAHALRERGVGPDVLVGLCVERSLEMVVGILGILKAGGAYVPLDPSYPSDRLAYMLEDSAPAVVLVQRTTAQALPASNVPQLVLDDDASNTAEAALSSYPTTPIFAIEIGLRPDHLAYVIYTSGSTGRPKGVLVEHRHVGRLLQVTEADFGFDASDVWTLFHSYAFDFSVWELWGALAYGGQLVIVPGWMTRSPDDFYALVESQGVTVLNQTPTAFTQFMRVDAERQAALSLRAVVFGGEALNLSELSAWVDRRGDASPQLVNMYGITETTVHVTYRRILREDIAAQRGSVIGRALSDLRVYLFDAQQNLVPQGVPGEMYVAGGGVARGYLRRPELTAARFVDNPHRPGERLYRTGDLARYVAHDELEYLGRIDGQVKVRGFRIELGEIEQQLSALPDVSGSTVIVREDVPGEKRLVAYVVPTVWQEDRIHDGALIANYRAALAQRLPEYMVPSAYVVLAALPLTVNGKVDRKALPAPDGSIGQNVEYVAPRDAVEAALCAVWEEVLKRERVGVQDNFFSLGGDSILSIRVVSLLKKQGLLLAIKDLFQHQTIAQVAPSVQREDAASATQTLAPFALLTESERAGYDARYDDAYPMSTLQAGMVFHTQLEQFNGIYHDIMADHVKCAWDQARFETALASCMQEHPILRTGFRLEGDRPLQHVHASMALPLTVEDLRDRSEAEQATYLSQWMETHKHHVFDWERGPLFQIHIFRRTEASFEFVISFHHAVLDGWSRAALTTTLYNRYERALAGETLEDVTPDWTYRDFVALEQEVLADPAAAAHFATMLEGPSVVTLPRNQRADAAASNDARPTDGAASDVPVIAHRFVAVDALTDLSPRLIDLSQQWGVPVPALLLAVHFKVLSTLSGQQAVVSCVTHNGRPEQAGAERGLGLFLNSLPTGLTLVDGSWHALVDQVAALSAQQMAYRRYPLAKIQQDLGMELGEISFNYTHFHVYNEMTTAGDAALEVLGSSGFEQTNFDLLVDVSRSVADDRLRLALVYNTGLFDHAQIEAIGDYYVRACEQLLAGLDQSHRVQSLLSDVEQQRTIAAGRGATQAYPLTQPLHAQFADQAERTPEALALRSDAGELSYRELDERSDRLARHLLEAGVAPGERVGLYLSRSLEQVIGLLGVLKAGATYVPLEPGQPRERLRYLMHDAQIAWVLLESSRMDTLPLDGVDVVLMDGAGQDPQWLSEYAQGALPDVASTSPAYVIYTSGSTGHPKGVLVSHQSLSNYVWHAVREYLDGLQGAVVSSPLGFDATITTLLPPLLVGKPVILLADDERTLPQLSERLFAPGAGWMFKITPAHLEALSYLDRTESTGDAPHCIVVGGEQLTVATLRRWKGELLPAATFVNEYGPTEATVGCSVWRVSDATALSALDGVAAPIGRAIDNTRLYVLGEGMQLQPMGSVGELYIGGDGVALGYLGRDELTRERFVADPFDATSAGKLYRTGDLVRYEATGELTFLGRRDEQVKLRGFRIELGEIEQQLAGLPDVQAATVALREDAPGEKRLVAYVVPTVWQEDRTHDGALIAGYRAALAQRLPEYMVPSAYVVLEALPLTVNGKVDRKALPAPDGNAGQEVQYVAPRDAVEAALCAVWEEVLKRERVGVQDNFFSLGGDSILSIRVVSLLKKQGLLLAIKDLFQHQTIAQLAPSVQREDGTEPTPTLAPFALLTESERAGYDARYDDAYPMSTLQAGMVFHTQLEQFNGIYHDIMADHVKCAWDQAHFETALASCMAEHPILRTGFRLEGDRPLQHVHAQMALPLTVEDLRDRSEVEQAAYLSEWMETHKHHVFDWERGPLFQIHIFRRTDESFEFVISFHHAVLDGWSRAALTTTLYNRYERALAGETLEAVVPDWTYRDFVALEQEVLADPAAAAHFATMLEGRSVVTLPRTQRADAAALNDAQPSDDSASDVPAVAHRFVAIDALTALSPRLIDLSQQWGVPVPALLLAVHFKVLSTLSGQQAVISCVTHNGRPEQAGAEHGLGLFLNSLPTGLTLVDGSWHALVDQVAALSAQQMAYRRYPLAKIQQDLGMELGEISFNYTHFHVYNEMTTAGDAALEVLGSSGFEQTNFDLLVDVSRSVADDRLRLALIYNTGLFDHAQIEAIGGYYVRACEQLLAGLDQSHRLQSLLSDVEQQRTIAAGRGATQAYPSTQPLHAQFADQAERTPEALALRSDAGELTYRELDERSDRLARHLLEAGVAPGERVGLYLSRSLEQVIGLLGVLKAGATYVPLEPGQPRERLRYLMGDAQMAWVLLESSRMDTLPLDGVDVVLMDGAGQDPQWLSEYAQGALPSVTATSPAYVIYTSGSTGHPKGVLVSHHSLSNYVWHAVREYLDGLQGAVVSSPLGFDATITTLLPPLLVGKPVILLADDERTLPQLSERLFAPGAGWVFKITPAHLEALSYLDRTESTRDAPHCVVVGGEQLTVATLRRWKGELLPAATFVNEYGPTEATVGCSIWRMSDATALSALDGVAAPIGRAIDNTRLYVLGEGMQLQPMGSVGELYIGGDGVALGYLGRDELTRERFVADPFDATSDGKLYRTGDLVRYEATGELTFLGRRDEQVKLRGFRIELGEIEQQLAGLPDVQAATVALREDVPGEKRLVAYVVPTVWQEDRTHDGALIAGYRAALAQRLPEYMVPSAYVVLEALPLTVNGKVDRKALPAPDGNAGQEVEYVAPRDAVEAALCAVWEEVLKRERVGVQDNFFSLGGDSILSIRVVSLLKKQGLLLAIKDLFQHQTIAQLAPNVQREDGAIATPTLAPFALLTESERAGYDARYEDAYPMSALQAGMVFHTQLEQFSGVFHDIVADHVQCPWDRECFETALASCVHQHPILRTGFRLEGDRPLQHVHASMALPLTVEDLRDRSEAEQASYLSQWMDAHKHHVFDWERGPLFQIHVFRRTDATFEFVVSFHHAVLDGWSRTALTTTLYSRYERALAGEALEDVAPDWTYRDFVAQEQDALADPAAKAYFGTMLDEAPTVQLPRLPATTERRQVRTRLDEFEVISVRLVELARTLGVPVQSILLAVHFKALSAFSGQQPVLSCVTYNGRPETEGAEQALGLFLNSLPQNVTIPSGSWREWIQAVAEMSATSMAYRRYPLAKIQQDVGRSFSEVMFNYTHFHVYNQLAEVRDDALLSLATTGFEQSNFDLVIDISRGLSNDSVHLVMVYDAQVFEASLIERLGTAYLRACEHLLADVDAPHTTASLLAPEERTRLLGAFNATDAAFPAERCLHELFEAQAARAPDAPALIFEGATLCYGDLEKRANQLAHALRERGVGPDVLVGLCVERSLEMVVGILGILKAGGAYVPLDPGYPSDRLAYMLEDSAPAVLLVQQATTQALPASSVPQLVLDGDSHESVANNTALSSYPTTPIAAIEIGLRPDHLAYVIYTSGSTGRPKGVMNEHRGVVNRLHWAQHEYALTPDDRLLQKTPYSFDVSVWELLLPFLAGAALVIAKPDGHQDPVYLAELIERERVGTVHFVPSMLQVFLEHAPLARCTGLRRVLCSGEALPYASRRAMERELPMVELHNLYGPTEAAIDVTSWRCERGVHEGIVPIGAPIANTRIYILDGLGQPTPIGVAGEIHIGGANVARGYLNRPELTAERFVRDPFHENPDARMYRTGDLGRWLPDGLVEHLGRNDFQVKIRGLRIELGEIEQQLMALDGITGALVTVANAGDTDARLVAYVTSPLASEDIAVQEAEQFLWREQLRQRLPDYMLPTLCIVLAAWPLLPNGKIDRRALPAPEARNSVSSHVAPAGPTQIALAQLWAELLKQDMGSIGARSNFFALGGHSLLAIKLIAGISRVFSVELSLRDAMATSTLGEQADLIMATSMKSSLLLESGYEIGDDEMEVSL